MTFWLNYKKTLWLFLFPYLFGMTVLLTVPAISTAVLAFTRFDSLQPPMWAGLENFQTLFSSSVVRQSLKNSLFFVATAVPLRLIFALSLALFLNRSSRLAGWARAAVYFPTIIPPPAYALLGLWLFNPLYGPLNLAIGGIGLSAPAWLTDGASARWMFVLLALYQLGEGFIVLLIALQTIPRAYYETAQIYGGTRWQQFYYVTLPLLRPWLLLLALRDILLSLQNTFVPSYMITYGGPYYATTFAPLLIYEIAFDLFDFGLAAAVMLLLFCVLALVVANVWLLWGDE